MFCQRGRDETKNGRRTKRHQNRRVQKLFGAVEKNTSRGVLHQTESALKTLKLKHGRINTPLLTNKFWIWGEAPLHVSSTILGALSLIPRSNREHVRSYE